MGTSSPGRNGGKQPQKSDTWVISSPNREYIERAAALWGGTVEAWQKSPKEQEWRVITKTDTLPVYVLPFPPQQSLELFSDKRRMVTLRCDGVKCRERGPQGRWEERPCECDPENNPRPACGAKLTTRVSFLLPNMPAVGTWMLETHGYYAAVEMPTGMEFARVSGRLVARALLRLEQRRRVDPAGGPDRIFYVPVLHLESPPSHLEALAAGDAPSLGSQAKALMAGDPLQSIGEFEDPPFDDAGEAYTEQEFKTLCDSHGLPDEARAILAAMKLPLGRVESLLNGAAAAGVKPGRIILQVASSMKQVGQALSPERLEEAISDAWEQGAV